MILLNTISNKISNYIISLLQLNSFLLKFLKHHTRSGSKLKPCNQIIIKVKKLKCFLACGKDATAGTRQDIYQFPPTCKK